MEGVPVHLDFDAIGRSLAALPGVADVHDLHIWNMGSDEVALSAHLSIARGDDWSTSEQGVFVCGDAGRGQSLIVWAIAEGRSCAASVDHHLMGETGLPSPVRPTDRPLV